MISGARDLLLRVALVAAVLTGLLAIPLVGTAAAAPPSNDAFADATVLAGGSGTLIDDNVDATRQVGEPNHASVGANGTVWYSWTAPGDGTASFDTFGSNQDSDTFLAAYTGTSLTGLTLQDEVDDSGGLQSRISFPATSGTTYLIAAGSVLNLEIDFHLTWKLSTSAPANDDFADALQLPFDVGRVTGDNQSATAEVDEPQHDGDPDGGASVWYRWAAPISTEASISIETDGFTPIVAVYSGAEVDELTLRVDGTGVPFVNFEAEAESVYWIVVDGDGGTGVFDLGVDLNADPPPNDLFADAEAISGASGIAFGSNYGAGDEPDEPEHGGNSPDSSVWYSWTAPSSGLVTFGTGQDWWRQEVAAYTGASVDALTAVEPLAGSPSITFEATGGTTYAIAVDGNSGGLFDLTWGPTEAVFSDVGPTHPFHREIGWMVDHGITTGFEDGGFHPSANVSRQAMSAFIFRTFSSPLDPMPDEATFSDVPLDHPFSYEVEWMDAAEITTGFPDGTFHPSSSVTRQAMSAFLFRFAGEPSTNPPSPTFDDVSANHPFYEEIEWMADTGVTTGFGDGTFRPSAPVTRQAMSAFIYRFWVFMD